MARVLEFHPHQGYRVPGYPNTHLDAEQITKEARLRGQTDEEYVASLLAFHWPDGKPAYKLSTNAPENLAAVAKAAADAATKAEKAAENEADEKSPEEPKRRKG